MEIVGAAGRTIFRAAPTHSANFLDRLSAVGPRDLCLNLDPPDKYNVCPYEIRELVDPPGGPKIQEFRIWILQRLSVPCREPSIPPAARS